MLLLHCLLIVTSFAHFTLTHPPNRAGGSMKTAGWCTGADPSKTPQNGTCLWFNDGCLIGCAKCDWNMTTAGMGGCGEQGPIKPTLPLKYLTYPNMTGWPKNYSDALLSYPWRAPGTAPVESSCGLAGGYYWSKLPFPGNGNYPPQGVQFGMDGRDMPESIKTEWQQGSHQEVAISVNANHGGGYAYRLCPKPGPYEQLTEECFQNGHLDFVGTKQWVQWSDDESRRFEIEAVRVDEGTFPNGSQWTRFPMPPCGGYMGGDAAGGSQTPGRVQAGADCDTTQFKPPIPDLYGYGLTQCFFPGTSIDVTHYVPEAKPCNETNMKDVKNLFNVNFIDLVKVPDDIPPGEYVMSWRHDCEQTSQVWTTCADIIVTAK